MLGITDRYILKEVVKVFLAVLGTVMLIVVSMLFLRTLEQVNTGALGSDLVLRFMGLQVARDISSLIPPVFFISVLMTLGRMARSLTAVYRVTVGASTLSAAVEERTEAAA